MNTFLLHLCSYHQPRRVRVIENVLQNHQTVANLFWAQQYGILNWLGSRRGLERAQFDHELNEMQAAGLVQLDDKFVHLTPAGVSYQESHPGYHPRFFDWYWLANTKQVEQRFLLAVQVISEFAYHNRYYVPLNVPYGDQQIVKNWFHHYYSPMLVSKIYEELHQLGESLASESPQLVATLFRGLVGHDDSGQTITQLGPRLGLVPGDELVVHQDIFMAVAAYARSTTGPLARLIQPLLNASPLSVSCQQTIDLLTKGMPIAEISSRRYLRPSTIREHILTAAILAPHLYDWKSLLPSADYQQLAQKYTGNVADWHFTQWSGDANRDFFMFRLYEILQGGE